MKKHLVAIAAVLLLFSLAGSFYIIREDEQAVVLRLGKVTAARTEPGLYFKIPFMDKITVYSKKSWNTMLTRLQWSPATKKTFVFDTIALFMIKEPRAFTGESYHRLSTAAS